MRNTQLRLALALSLPLLLLAACSSTVVNGTDNDGGTDDGGGSGALQIPGCVGACSVNYNCPSTAGPTTLTGTVTIPSGALPLYNAQVYIPTGDVIPDPPTTGVSCDRCGAVPSQFATKTNEKGQFVLKDIPSGQNIPLIIRVGKWRRVVTIPSVAECAPTALDATQTRLPRNQSEGNIPKIALSTGALDAMECILRKDKLGLDDSEFTNATGNGRVNLYAGVTGTDQYSAGNVPFATSNPWWDTAANWQKYDIVMLSCEGYPDAYTQKSVQARQNLQTYLDLGGRIFASHWHNFWLQNSVASPTGEPSLKTVAQFVDPTVTSGYSNDTATDEATINTNFAKGAALQQWLSNNKGLNANNKLPVNFTRVTLTKVNGNVNPAKANPDPAITQNWLNLTKTAQGLDPGLASPPSQYFSFYAPLSKPPAEQCGQMVFTDLHVSGGPTGDHSGKGTPLAFPKGCTTSGLTPQEMALIFMLFDLTSCVSPIIG